MKNLFLTLTIVLGLASGNLAYAKSTFENNMDVYHGYVRSTLKTLNANISDTEKKRRLKAIYNSVQASIELQKDTKAFLIYAPLLIPALSSIKMAIDNEIYFPIKTIALTAEQTLNSIENGVK